MPDAYLFLSCQRESILPYSTNRRSVNWLLLLVGAVLTAILALSVHVVMLQILNIPFPSGYPHAGIGAWLNTAAAVLAAILLYVLGFDRFKGQSLITRSLVLFLLITMLQELFFRAPMMEGVATTAWAFSFLSNLPRLLNWLLLSFLIVALGPWLRGMLARVIASIALYAIVFLAFRPFLERVSAPVITHFAYLAHDEVYGLPYGLHVLIPAYLTFAEPVLAAFVIAALLWDRLSPRTPMRLLEFTLIILLIRCHLIALAIYPFYAKMSTGVALLSMGQFTLETMMLGVMTGLTWHYATTVWSRSTRSAERSAA